MRSELHFGYFYKYEMGVVASREIAVVLLFVCQTRKFFALAAQSSRVGYNHYYKKTAEVVIIE